MIKKEWWNEPITYHVKDPSSGGAIVVLRKMNYYVETTRGKYICEAAYELFSILATFFLCGGFACLFLPLY